MKEGAGGDPFADDDPSPNEGESSEPPVSDAESTASAQETQASSDTTQTQTVSAMQIPYKFRRDGVQEGRDRVPLFLQPKTKGAERDALRELEDHFDDDVSLTDLREALMMVGLDHLDEVSEHLESWGYGMTFD